MLHFKDGWTTTILGSNTIITQPAFYDIHRMRSGGFVFALRDGTGAYSTRYYALASPFTSDLTSAARSDWEQGSPVGTSDAPQWIESNANAKTIRVQGNNLQKSGEFFPASAALPSPDGRYVIVFSYSSCRSARPAFYGFMGGSEPGQGEIFLDLYVASSGKKILTRHFSYSGFGPSILFKETEWITNRCLVMPTDFLSRRALMISLIGLSD